MDSNSVGMIVSGVIVIAVLFYFLVDEHGWPWRRKK